MKRLLVACIGNIFLGDDGFGVEVARALARRSFPTEVTIRDLGIRGYDLACALADGYDGVILVDATPRGQAPGTIYLIEPDLANLDLGGEPNLDGHGLEPMSALRMAASLGGVSGRLYLVGCEPGVLPDPEGWMGLSEAVEAAVPRAVELIESVVRKLLNSEESLQINEAPAMKGAM